MQQIMGLLGVKGAGKDTAAKLFIETYGYQRIAFGDALYQEVADAFRVTVPFLNNRDTKETPLSALRLSLCADTLFVRTMQDIAEEKGEALDLDAPQSPRWVLQMWGTEYRRMRQGYDAYWLDRVQEVIDANPTINFVITDVRYTNEAEFVKRKTAQRFGRLIRVRRPVLEEQEARNRAANGTAAHRSETEMLGYPVQFEAHNIEGDPLALLRSIDAWYQMPAAA